MRRRARQMLPTHQCHFAAPRLRRAATPAASSQLSISILSNKTNQRNHDYCHAALLCDGAIHRHRGGSNPCGQSPMDFKSISLAARTHCLKTAAKQYGLVILCCEKVMRHWPRCSRERHMPPRAFLSCEGDCRLSPQAMTLPCRDGQGLIRFLDSEGIRTPAGRAQWISSPSP